MKNKKNIGIIAAIVFVLLIGVAGLGNDSDTTTVTGVSSTDSGYIYEETYNDSVDDETKLTDVSESVTNKVPVSNSATQSTTRPQTGTVGGNTGSGNYKVGLSNIPSFTGSAYVSVNSNVPGLSKGNQTSTYFENYASLDSLGRCGVAFACLGPETMPDEERGAIGSVKPSGWQTVKYDIVDGKYLYNRCHLIGFQLSGENANTRNLITGTRFMNVEGMLPFENMVADYIKETGNHVLYRVTPVFKGSELVARGVQIEAYSVEDEGDGICFNVYCYNNQPGIEIDYATGKSWLSSQTATTQKPIATTEKPQTTKQPETTTQKPVTTQSSNSNQSQEMVWIPESGKRYHCKSTCSGMKNPTKVTVQEAKEQGYTPCGRCY